MSKISFHIFSRLPAEQKRITLSTSLTLLRIALVPCVVGAMIMQSWGLAFMLFVAASVTDVLDGWLARLLGEQTFLGACLDPLADKFLLLSVFATLAFVHTPLFTIPTWFVLLVLAKELFLVGGAIGLFAKHGHVEIRPTQLGKLGTFAQIIFVVWLFACYFFHWMPQKTYYTMLGLLIVVTFATLIHYVRIGMRTVLCQK